ncbi:hypothetical protein BGZ73_005421 [Actinomortierella ambigua]|nr:hypothetical protein BGZ73_005421 [Actinomortierella ambigua]
MTNSTFEHELYEIKSQFLKKSKFEIYYMETRARAELPRMILEYVGASYTNRAPVDWPKGKNQTFFGYLPQLIHTKPDGTTFEMSETKALTRYIARLFELDGANVEENATLDMLLSCSCDNILDLMMEHVWMKPEPEKEESFERFLEHAKYVLDGFERFLVQNGSNGHFLHTKTTAPDFAYFDWMQYFLSSYPIAATKAFEKERPASFKLYQRLNSHPRIRAYIDGGRWEHRSSSPFLGVSTAGFFTKDWERALKFYTEKLGLECTMNINPAPEMDANQRYLQFELPYSKTKFTLFCPGTIKKMEKRGGDMVTFNVHNVEDAYVDLEKKGVEFKFKPMKETWGMHAQLADPDGNIITLFSPLPRSGNYNNNVVAAGIHSPLSSQAHGTLLNAFLHHHSHSASYGHPGDAALDPGHSSTATTASANTSSSTTSHWTVDRASKVNAARSPSAEQSSFLSYDLISRDLIESIAQYPERAAREMLEPNVSLLLRESSKTGGASGSLTAEVQQVRQQQQQQQQQQQKQLQQGKSLLQFDPFSSRSHPLGTATSSRSTMRSQQSMWAARRRHHQPSPEYVLQDMQAFSTPPFSKDQDSVFHQCQQPLGASSPLPSLETLLMGRLGLDTVGTTTTWTATNTQFSGFSSRDFIPLSANGRLATDLFRSGSASQEHVILAGSSASSEAATGSGASTAAAQQETRWGSNSNNNTTTTASTVPGMELVSFADEFDHLATTLFRPVQSGPSAAGAGAALSRTAVEAELYRFGSVVHERLLDVPSFLQSGWSRQDLTILGLERVVHEAMAPRVSVADKVQLAALMMRHDFQNLLSVGTLQAWKEQLMEQGTKKLFHDAGIEKGAWQSRIETTLERIQHPRRGLMSQETWEVRTMPFRTKLAIFRKSGILPTKSEYGDFMSLGLKAERYEQVYQAFHHLVEHGGEADTKLYTMYITGLVRQGRMDHALEVVRGMERMNVAPSVVTYGVMIDGYGKQQDGAGMLATLQAMQRAGLEPNLPIYSSLLANLIRSKEFFKALKVHDRLIASKLELDDTTRNSLVKLLQHTKGSQAAYLSLLERLGATNEDQQSSSNNSSHRASSASGRRHHSSRETLSSSLSSRTRTKHTTDLRDSPSGELAGFNKALDGFAEAVDVVRFTEAYQTMRERGLSPNRYTYNTLLKFYKRTKSGLENSLEVLRAMNAKYPLEPDVVAYTTVMQHAAATAAASTNANAVSTSGNGRTRRRGAGSMDTHPLTTSTSSSALGDTNATTHSNNSSSDVSSPMDVAWDLYDEMMQRQVRLDLVTYATLIEMVGQDPSSAKARTMVRRHFIAGPHRHGFTVSPECDRATGLGLAAQLYVQLLNQGLEPNEVVFGSLMHVVIRRGFIQEVEGIYGEMVGRRGMAPNTALLTNLIQGFSHVRDFESGWKVWEFMVAHNVPRNAITYSHLVRLCERCFHPNYLEAMWWQQQKQQQKQEQYYEHQQQRAGRRPAGWKDHEFDRFGVRIERFGDDENPATPSSSLKRHHERAERGRALGLSDTADRVMTPPPGAGYGDRYELPSPSSSSTSTVGATMAAAAATSSAANGGKRSHFRDWIPLEICDAIEQQMKADGVSWSKVQRFRKGIREMKAKDPIVARIEQLSVDSSSSSSSASLSSSTLLGDGGLDTAAAEDRSQSSPSTSSTTTTTAAAATSGPEVTDLSKALLYEPVMKRGGSSSSVAQAEGSGKTLEVAGLGLGHGYIPQRTLPPNVQVDWNNDTQAPVVREWKAGEDAEYQRLDSKAVLRQYPFLASHPYEWWKTYRKGSKVEAGTASTATATAPAGEQQQEPTNKRLDGHAKRVQKMEKRRVKALQTPAKSPWTDEVVQQLEEEEERAFAIPGRP